MKELLKIEYLTCFPEYDDTTTELFYGTREEALAYARDALEHWWWFQGDVEGDVEGGKYWNGNNSSYARLRSIHPAKLTAATADGKRYLIKAKVTRKIAR